MSQSKSSSLTKAYALPHFANPGKLKVLQSLYAQYTQEYRFHLQDRWHRFLKGDKTALTYLGSTKMIPTQLPSAILQGLLKCVTEHLKAYLSSQQALIRRVIQQSTLSPSDKHSLHSLNSQRLWTHSQQYHSETQTCLNWHYVPAQLVSTDNFGQQRVSENTGKVLRPIRLTQLRLIRQISQYTQTISPLKAPVYPRLLLDTRAIQFQSAQTSKKHAHWLSITTLKKNQRVKVPVLLHDYAKSVNSDFNGSVELLFRDKGLQFVVTATQESEAWLTHWLNQHQSKAISVSKTTDEIVAFDIGLCTLLASSEGNLYGQYWLKKLTGYDQKLTILTAQRQKLGLKAQGKRQAQLVQQIRGFIKTEIGRLINAWVLSHPHVKTIVLEKLYFQNPALSKRLNRIIQNFGLSRIKTKFQELGKLRGFSVVEVHPAYSSQECTHCGWVSELNRLTQKQFQCECCGSQHHADTGSGKTLKKRFLSGHYAGLHSKGQCLSYLRSQFMSQLTVRIRHGIVDPKRLAFLLSKGVNGKRGFIAEPVGLALLTDALKRVLSFQ